MVKRQNKHVVIVDNATTCAMRLKTLVEIHGAEAKLLHWSDAEQQLTSLAASQVCLLVIEETVPSFVVENIIEFYPNVPLFLLFNGDRIESWNISKPVNPLSMSLSNYELMAMLEPYWAEEKAINLPDALILDSDSSKAHICAKLLFSANIQCAVADQLDNIQLTDFDMVLANISDNPARLEQIVKAKRANPYLGVILYGDASDFKGFEFIQEANLIGIDDVIAQDKLDSELLGRFNRVWRKVSEFRDDQLVMSQNQHMMDKLLEQSLVLKVLFSSAIDGIVAFNQDGEIRRVNGSFAELLGYQQDYMLKANFYACLTTKSQREVQEALAGDYFQQQQVIELKLQHRHKVEIPVSAAINRINFHGEFVYVAVTRNVSAQYLQEKILLKKNEQLQHQVKECKKQQEANFEIVRKGQRARSAFLSKVSRLGQNAAAIPNWANKLSNIDLIMRCEANQLDVTRQEVDLQFALQQAVEPLQELANEKQVLFHLESDNAFTIVQFPTLYLQIVFQQVLDNAIRYNLSGGEVRTYIERGEDELVVNICDTGTGVLDHKHQQVLDVYQANLNDDNLLCTGLPLASSLMSYFGGQLKCGNYLSDNKVNGTQIQLLFPY